MKKFNVNLIVAFITFLVGTSVVLISYFIQESNINNEVKTEESVVVERLKQFENKRLELESDGQRTELQNVFNNYFTESKHEKLNGLVSFRELRLISKINNKENQNVFAVIEMSQLVTIPGNCGLHFKIFDTNGRFINSVSFYAGYRIRIKDIKVRYSSEIGRNIVEVSSEPVINGRDIVKQYYALIGKEIKLIRLENSKGQSVRNIYGTPNITIGPNKIELLENKWKESLKSSDAAQIMSSLLWLSGEHLNLEEIPDYYHENVNEALFAQDLNNDNEINVEVDALSDSKNMWIKEIAKLTKNRDIRGNDE